MVLPNLADPKVAKRFANQAVAGGNPYGPPPTAAQGNAAANALGLPRPGAQKQPSNRDLAAGMAFANAVLGGGGGSNDGGYGESFNASLAASRQSINQQVQAALDEIARQEVTGTAEVNTLPGTYDSITNSSNAAITQHANAAQNAQLASGFRSFTPAGVTANPLIDANNTATAFLKGGVPLIRLGVQDASARNRGQVRQVGMGLQADLDTQQRQFEMQQAHDAAARQADNSMKLLDIALSQAQDKRDWKRHIYDLQHEDKASATEFKRNQSLYDLKRTQDAQDQETAQLRAGGIPMTGQQAERIRNSSLYSDLMSWMRANPDKDTTDWINEKIPGDLASPALRDFISSIVMLGEYDVTPKNSYGGIPVSQQGQ